MTTPQKNISCQMGCWALALGIALVTTVGCLVFGEMTKTGAIFLGIVAFFVSGAMLGWLLCRPLPPLGGATDQLQASTEAAPVKTEKQASEPAPAGSGLKPSTPLAGEAELASRKGTWRYEGTQTAANNAAAQTAHAEPAKEAEPHEVTGTAPQKLDGPRGGVADDLKRIKGIGPKLEQLCHSLGFFHFDQVANWTDEEVAWVDANLEGFKGRVTRDQWVAQAKELAKG